MRAPNSHREQTAAFYREFILPVEDQDPLSKPLSCGVQRWFKSANIRDLYLFRQRDDFLRIGSRLLGRGGLGPEIEPRSPPAIVLPFPASAAETFPQ
jgi:hypothetical protein